MSQCYIPSLYAVDFKGALNSGEVHPIDATVELHFLVQDGEIRANATVRYVKAGSGLGLQFETVRSEDRARAEMVKRLMQAESPATPTTKVLA
jgi:glucan biosynthesis protein